MDTGQAFPELPRNAFAKADPSPDTAFYTQARLVEHIDPAAIAAVTGLYREFVPAGGTRTLAEYGDLEKNAVSHRGNAFRALEPLLRDALGR